MKTTAKRNGFTLVESLMAVIMFTISGLAFSSFVTISANKQSQTKAKLSVTQARAQILALIANKSVWTKNLRDAGRVAHPTLREKTLNPELACLRDGTLCNETQTGYDLSLTDQNGKIMVDAIDQNQGFTKDGAVCANFSQSDETNNSCPWRLALKWKPLCPKGKTSCTHPQVTIDVEVKASAAFVQANNLSTIHVSLMMEQPRIAPAFAKRIMVATNSVHYGYPSTLTIDPAPYVISESPGIVTFELMKSSSYRGGTISMSGQNIVYSPAYNIVPVPTEKLYGMDWFNYKIIDSYTGIETVATIYVQVMTPYTWTGLAGGGDQNINTKKNYCGMVVEGKCDGATFPNRFLSATAEDDTNLIFNENCTNCNVEIATPVKVASLETSPYFAGTIAQKTAFSAGAYTASYGRSVWRRLYSFRFNGGTWDGQAGELFIPRQGEANVCWGCAASAATYSYFRVENGTFKAPPNLRILGSIYISNASSFKHNGGTVNWMPIMQWPVTCAGDCVGGVSGVEFWNLEVGWPKASFAEAGQTVNGSYYTYGWGMRSFLESDITVLKNLTVSNHGESLLASRVGGPVRNIQLHGDLIASTYNGGGDYSYGNPAVIELVGKEDQTIFGQVLSETERRNPRNVNCLPDIVVNKPSGKLIAKDSIGLGGDFILRRADAFDVANINLLAVGWNYRTMNLDLNSNPISGLYYLTDGDPAPLYLDRDMTVSRLFYMGTNAGYPRLRSTNRVPTYLDVKGDAIFARNSLIERPPNIADKVTIRFNGDGNQSVTADMLQQHVIANHFVVDKPSGTITFAGELGVEGDFIITRGNTIFDPSFALHNLGLSADGYGHRLRLSMWDPINQVIPRLSIEGGTEIVTPVYVKDFTVFQLVHGNNTGAGFYAPTQPLYVSGDFTVGERMRTGGTPNLTRIGGVSNQQVILNGTAPQRINFNGDGGSPAVINGNASILNTVDMQIQNTSATPVKIMGKGTIGRMAVNAGSTVDLDIASSLDLTGTVGGVLNKNGTAPAGSLTVTGAGVINN